MRIDLVQRPPGPSPRRPEPVNVAHDQAPVDERRRVKIEDILRIVSRHYAVSTQDILSQRRHRSVVRPREVGMYLAMHLSSQSMCGIGRRFGDRDHASMVHAIRKIAREIGENPRFREEIAEMKRQLSASRPH